LGKLLIFIIVSCFGCSTVAVKNINSATIAALPLITWNSQEVENLLGPPTGVIGEDNYTRYYMPVLVWDSIGHTMYDSGYFVYQQDRTHNVLRFMVLYISDKSKSKVNHEAVCIEYGVIFDKNPGIKDLAELVPEISSFNNPMISTFYKADDHSNVSIFYVSNKIDGDRCYTLQVKLRDANEPVSPKSIVNEIRVKYQDYNWLRTYGLDGAKQIAFIPLH
jgi:hypothetical protein